MFVLISSDNKLLYLLIHFGCGRGCQIRPGWCVWVQRWVYRVDGKIVRVCVGSFAEKRVLGEGHDGCVFSRSDVIFVLLT